MHNVLLVEDSLDIHLVIAAALKPLQVQLVSANSVCEAEYHLADKFFSLIILDLGLPDGDGLSILNRIREDVLLQKTQVMILTANADISSKLSAFSIGADDYITKPFNALELRARVDSKLRRLSKMTEAEEYIQAGPLVLEVNKLMVKEKTGGVSIQLSSIEFRIFALLARRPGNLFSRDQILNQIWGGQVHVSDRTIDTHVYTLRKKLGEFADLIKSIQGEGYLFGENRPRLQAN